MWERKPKIALPKEAGLRQKAVVEALQKAMAVSGGYLTMRKYDAIAKKYYLPSSAAVRSVFGSWDVALKAAEGLEKDNIKNMSTVITAAEEVLKRESRFQTLTQFYVMVAAHLASKGVALHGKETYGYDVVRRILRSSRPDLVEEAQKRVSCPAAAGARVQDCVRHFEEKLARGLLAESDFKATVPSPQIILEACLHTGADAQMVRQAWRKVRAKVCGLQEEAEGAKGVVSDFFSLLKRTVREAETILGEFEALRAKVKELQEENVSLRNEKHRLETEAASLRAMVQKLENETAKLRETITHCYNTFRLFLDSRPAAADKVAALKVTVDRCYNVIKVEPAAN